MPETLRLSEAAQFMKITPQTLRKLVASGEIPAVRIGRQWRFYSPAIEAWLTRGTSIMCQQK
jgi:excisionase family DNA binding protein